MISGFAACTIESENTRETNSRTKFRGMKIIILHKTHNTLTPVVESKTESPNNTEEIQEEKKLDSNTDIDKSLKRKTKPKETTETSKRKIPRRQTKENPLRDPNFIYKTQVSNSETKDDQDADEQVYVQLSQINKDPINFKEAVNSSEGENLKSAIREELKSMEENNVWEIVDYLSKTSENKRPNVIDSKWVFKRKLDKTVKKLSKPD
ncbi:hypothetical protein TSAR_016015 [Trichomalopsis sarcophagae]|uniref:Uncharacterized protein n=1 Tax=Trichomalopsis sarcophagae TaxID=543379 RepID=A0A232ENL2_9HYME|nr:hypothetical protein TSAR_016015 [Trichomalopsis sarcophagae]